MIRAEHTHTHVRVQIKSYWQKLELGFYPGEIKTVISTSRILNFATASTDCNLKFQPGEIPIWIITEMDSNFCW